MCKPGNKLRDSLAFPLGSHVPDSVDGRERELTAVFKVAREVPVGRPGSPLLGNWPGLLLDPSARSKGCHCAIRVTRVVHQAISIWVAEKNVIDPDRCLTEPKIVLAYLIAAVFECSIEILKIEALSHVCAV